MISLGVTDRSMVAEVRRQAVSIAQFVGFDQGRQGEVAIVATEAASNLVKHAQRGEMLIGTIAGRHGAGIDLITVDHGPGMTNVAECMRDGYTTAGSKGIGLGAMARLSSQFDIYSQPGKGSVLAARLWNRPDDSEAAGLVCGAVCVPYPGEQEAGDSWALRDSPGGGTVLVVDGLGHGRHAAQAAAEACRIFAKAPIANPADALERMHVAMQHTRGGAGSVAQIDYDAGQVVYAGVGNVAGSVAIPGSLRKMISQNGTLGQGRIKSRNFDYVCNPGSLIILHSDGLATHWNLDDYPMLTSRHPSVIAGLLYRDHRRAKDDVTVVVAQRRR